MNSPAGTQALCILRFEGRRFEQHRFDVACAAALLAYRKLVLECAKELGRRARPDRVRLPIENYVTHDITTAQLASSTR